MKGVGEPLRRWCLQNPLALLAIVGVVGILAVDGWRCFSSFLLGWPALLALLFALWRPRLWKFVPVFLLGFGWLHSVRLEDTYRHPLRMRLLDRGGESVRVTILGRLVPWPDNVEDDEKRAGCEILRMRWEGQEAFEEMPARLRAFLPAGYRLREPGVYELTGRLSLPKPPISPGQFDRVDYSLRMGWVGDLRVFRLRKVVAEPWSLRFHLLRGAAVCRQWMTKALSLGVDPESRYTGVVFAMALGASDAAGEEIEDAFRNSGTLHVFAVSGMQVVLVVWVFGYLLRSAGVSKTRAALPLVVMVFAYAYVTGWQPSAARAALMVSVVVIAPLFCRTTFLQNSLGAAGIILLLWNTHQFFMPGFQLSFGVVWSIALINEFFMERWRPWMGVDPMIPAQYVTSWQRFQSYIRTKIASVAGVSLSAWIGSMPLVFAHFRTVTPVALVANCALVPLSSGCIIFACVSFAFAGLGLHPLQAWTNQVNQKIAHGMVASATWFASWPWGSIHFDLAGIADRKALAELRVFQFSNGGAATYLRGGKSHWLIDCGSVHAWRSTLHPYLNQYGVNTLKGIILSHGDINHIGGAMLAFNDLPVGCLHTSEHEPWRYDSRTTTIKALSQRLTPGTAEWQRHAVDESITLAGGEDGIQMAATVLYPGKDDLHEKADDRCLALMVHAGKFRILWLGDAGFKAEKCLLERHSSLRCDILIRHQHAADYSGLPELLVAANPQVIISSNDPLLPEEQMPESIRSYCREAGIPLFDLHASGSVGMDIIDDQVVLEGYSNKQSHVIKVR